MSKAFVSAGPPIRLSFGKMAACAIAGLAVLSGGLAFGVVQLGSTLRLAGATVDPTPIGLRIGKHALDIPGNAIRFAEQRTAQPQSEVDLYLAWPSMTGFAASAETTFHDPEAKNLLFLRLTSVDAKTTSDDMPSSSKSDSPGPAGLIRSLRPGLPGIASEEAVYRPNADRLPVYVASCLDGKDAIMAADCIREVQIAPELRLRYRFSHGLLPQWDQIDRAVLAYVEAHRRS